jgi:hypothetical protein
MALAKANNTPVASMPAELAANTMTLAATVNEPRIMAMRQAPLKAQQPTEEEADISEVFVVRASPIDRTQLPAELAKTGSPASPDRSRRFFLNRSGPRYEICRRQKGFLKCQLLKTNLERAAGAP